MLPAVEVDAVLYNDGRMGHSLAEADAHPHIRLDLPPADHAGLEGRLVDVQVAPVRPGGEGELHLADEESEALRGHFGRRPCAPPIMHAGAEEEPPSVLWAPK